jgi:hypothetical protein
VCNWRRYLVARNSPVGEAVRLVTGRANLSQSTHLPVGRSHTLHVCVRARARVASGVCGARVYVWVAAGVCVIT